MWYSVKYHPLPQGSKFLFRDVICTQVKEVKFQQAVRLRVLLLGQTWIGTLLALPPSSGGGFSKSLNFSQPQVPHLSNGIITISILLSCEDKMD